MADNIELVVCTDDWNGLPFSCKHLLKGFLPETPVSWIETIGLRSPKFSWYDITRSWSKITGWIYADPQHSDFIPNNLTLKNPVLLPYNGIPLIRAFNTKNIVRCAGRPRLDHKRVFITTWPFLADVVGQIEESVSIYYRVDDFSQFPGVNKALIIKLEEELIERVDIVVATAEKLMPKNKDSRFVKYLPHGVDSAHFSTKLQIDLSTNPLAKYPAPRIGFFGLLNSWIDFDFIRGIAQKNPEMSIVLVGPSQLPEAELPKAPNIYYTGSVPYDILPKYANGFEVALIPFKINELTRAVNPLKLLEYFALGLPVISTSLPEVLKYGSSVIIVSDANEATKGIKWILKNDNNEARLARQKIASENSWHEKAIQLRKWIDDFFDREQNEARNIDKHGL